MNAPVTGNIFPDEAQSSGWADVRYQRQYFPYYLCFYLAYLLAGGFGQGLTIIPAIEISFWPPAGIFVATLLLNPKPTWPWWALAGCCAELTCNALWFHNPFLPSLVYFCANALEALTAAWLVTRYVGRPFRLESLEEVAAFVVLAAGVAPAVGATVGSAMVVWSGKMPFSTAWPLWWLGDGTGLLISTPLTLVAVQVWRDRTQIARARMIEAATVFIALLALSAVSFKGNVSTPYVTMPALLWASVRFQLRGAATALALITLMSAIFAINKSGAFAGDPALLHQKAIMLQTFLGISAVSALIVAALALQYRQALLSLKTVNAELETRVAERTAKLSESESTFRAMFEFSGVGKAEVDSVTGRFTRVNAAMCELTGYSESELLNLSFSDITHPDDRDADREQVRRLVSGELNSYDHEKRYVSRDGHTIWVRVNANVIRDKHGKALRNTAVIQDITARKQADEALRAAHASFSHLVEHSPFGIYAVDADFRLVMVADGARKVFENVHPLIGRDFADILRVIWPEPFASQSIALFRRTLETGEAYHAPSTVERRHDTAEVQSYDWKIERVMLPDRRFGVVCHFYDLSERQSYEEKLRLSEERLRLAAQAAEFGVYAFDPIERQSEWSRELFAMVGLAPSDKIKQSNIVAAIHPDDRSRFEEIMLRAIETTGSGSYAHEFRIVRPDGEVRWLADKGRADFTGEGANRHPVKVYGTVIDVTDRKANEQQTLLLMREVNHRSKNILSLVVAIARQTAAGDAKNFLARFQERILALASSQDLLVNSGWKGAQLKELVHSQLSHFKDLLGNRILVDGPTLTVNAPSAQALGLALHELATNAGKYGALSNDKGKVSISWELTDGRESARRFVISWIETGGPKVKPPARLGFGSTVINKMSKLSLNDTVVFDLAPAGLRWSLECAADSVLT
jgi:PAS domain S-box-containing protein